jgi:AAA ATPase domain
METRLAASGRHGALRGRKDECGLLDGLLADVRRGEGQSLVLRGEAGIGKTALLEYLIEAASDMTVLRAVRVESEMELAYASLHQLCGPVLDRLGGLAAPQRDALRVVFGVIGGVPPPDRFMVGLGMLSLLSEMAEERPLLCVVDDAQWLDQASAMTLAFVARRLLAEPVAIVFAAREPGETLQPLRGLQVRGLRNGDARESVGVARAAARVDRDAVGGWDLGWWMRRRSPGGLRRASCAGSRRFLGTPGCCCCWRRPSRLATRFCSGGRQRHSASGQGLPIARKARGGWRSKSGWHSVTR